MNFPFHKLSRSAGTIVPRPSRRVGVMLVLGLALFGSRGVLDAQSGAAASESQVKAAFLLNFPKYVEWPAEKFATTNSPFVLTVVGDAAVAESLAKMAADRTINGRPVVVNSLSSVPRFTPDCHILFISDATRSATPEFFKRWTTANILTVGDSADFLSNGGAIRFARRQESIRLEVNLATTSQAQLKISSKLLSVADVVKGTSK